MAAPAQRLYPPESCLPPRARAGFEAVNALALSYVKDDVATAVAVLRQGLGLRARETHEVRAASPCARLSVGVCKSGTGGPTS